MHHPDIIPTEVVLELYVHQGYEVTWACPRLVLWGLALSTWRALVLCTEGAETPMCLKWKDEVIAKEGRHGVGRAVENKRLCHVLD